MNVRAGHADDGLEEVSLVDLRAQLGRRVDEAYHRGRVLAISRHHRRMAVLVPAELYDWFQQVLRDHGVHELPAVGGDRSSDAA